MHAPKAHGVAQLSSPDSLGERGPQPAHLQSGSWPQLLPPWLCTLTGCTQVAPKWANRRLAWSLGPGVYCHEPPLTFTITTHSSLQGQEPHPLLLQSVHGALQAHLPSWVWAPGEKDRVFSVCTAVPPDTGDGTRQANAGQ